MTLLTDYPGLLFLVSFVMLSGATWLAARFFRLSPAAGSSVFDDFGLIQGATLTLLGLIIGFSFSMAVGRYDQRKNLEEEEANAIGTEYVRMDLLPAAAASSVRNMLASYVGQRILFYTLRDAGTLADVDAKTAKTQAEIWSAVVASASSQPNPLTALAVSGMNDVLNAQGYAQAASQNRIPVTAWVLMEAMAICGSILVGMGSRSETTRFKLLMVLPLVVSMAFFLIADIDSPRGGLIKVSPQNLSSLEQSIRAR
jgi:hypothetical protein